MSRVNRVEIAPAERVPRYLTALGLSLALALVGEVILLFGTGSDFLYRGEYLIGAISSVPFAVGIAGGGYWLARSDLPPARYPRIAGWCAGGAFLFVLLNVALIAVYPIDSLARFVSWLRWAVCLGAGVGLLIGCIEGRAVERALDVERATLRARHAEDQRDLLDFLNGVLRHEVLNTAAIINGYASRLLEEKPDLDDESREWVEIVDRHAADMTAVVEDVRVLLQSTESDPVLKRTNLTRILTDEVRKLRDRCDGVVVETAIPGEVFVRGDDLLPRVFGNVLSNAVEHNRAATPRVEVTVERRSDDVRVEISDNGPGIPEETVDSLFDRTESRSSSHGMGLYLVSQLVERYDGAVTLAETGPGGSTFAIELPAAATRDEDRSVAGSADRPSSLTET